MGLEPAPEALPELGLGGRVREVHGRLRVRGERPPGRGSGRPRPGSRSSAAPGAGRRGPGSPRCSRSRRAPGWSSRTPRGRPGRSRPSRRRPPRRASSGPSASTAQAACSATLREPSIETCASASRCWTAWNEPMAAPYWRRSLAYPVASEIAPRMTPTRSAQQSDSPSALQRARSAPVRASNSPGTGPADPSGTDATLRVRSRDGSSTPSATVASPKPSAASSRAAVAPLASTASDGRPTAVPASSDRSPVSTIVSAVLGSAPASRRSSAASVGPTNATSARPWASSSATIAASTADASGVPSSFGVLSSCHPEAATADSRRATRPRSSRSATAFGPSLSTALATESRSATCSAESRVSISAPSVTERRRPLIPEGAPQHLAGGEARHRVHDDDVVQLLVARERRSQRAPSARRRRPGDRGRAAPPRPGPPHRGRR